ncbi:MAG: hypothetical protein UR28_C0008G0003 [Candidatus Peregrinibacteria bacterium GW2011_GWF2_33_10]|nr:MAG: hypothetical protein UR28_C0008G0003 [Candidatus Peregrinibacteria bacterium GW2011_GWF2_33_10]OGJ45206.1 MAG: hypothetical protein A2263_06565 [Candidatus Peregrinibacteria bacterium RIFOXYA2_FULL_33_21]OGJ46458.1 MAG: hypothetical protein A2272_00255 [Candidatus Peregrinibacteria bacterium RIFOXYA12_FULL_33_12]OGJ51130.1 MAG: hypothetical protein A2307_04650 [Candidatus Peregrinibacteria bacterium RIFOXYB2_FULL_33_20]
MPNFDKTGPDGQGSMTGQKLGSCVGNQQSGMLGSIRRGMGRGQGMGRKGGCCTKGFFRNSVSLEEQEKFLENKLANIRQLKEESKIVK